MTRALPPIIQGGMGVAVSNWQLARAVSLRGQLGVVSATGIDTVLTRRLQDGDEGGHMRRAFDAFPFPEIAERVWNLYHRKGGKPSGKAYKSKPLPMLRPSRAFLDLAVIANFAEVYLAKEGHDGLIGLNRLEKIQLPTLASLYGAMLAGVDYVLMGAGIPRHIPAVLASLASLAPSTLPIDVFGVAPGQTVSAHFSPLEFAGPPPNPLTTPKFLAIIASTTLALTLARKCRPPVDGFVVEGPLAGGHNAGPRGPLTLDESGQPIYGPKDKPDLQKIGALGLPFWLAGSHGVRGKLESAQAQGAVGIQVGTAFAFCNESGLKPELKKELRNQIAEGTLTVFTDPRLSPTGYPFKTLQVAGSVSEPDVVARRKRICDLGYLRELYMTPKGTVGYRCSGEPVEDYVRKGGDIANTVGRTCVCNSLMATVGFAQVRKGEVEPCLVTAGDDLSPVADLLRQNGGAYSADDVIDMLLS
ncbi:MAG: nitronate monooxygenase [Armatimonadetes bacterium]|nr:nitronate monooxygenase [Armatimonadota bacterium]